MNVGLTSLESLCFVCGVCKMAACAARSNPVLRGQVHVFRANRWHNRADLIPNDRIDLSANKRIILVIGRSLDAFLVLTVAVMETLLVSH